MIAATRSANTMANPSSLLNSDHFWRQQSVIGLIGGMSWESSAVYYRIINQAVRDRLGGLTRSDVLI